MIRQISGHPFSHSELDENCCHMMARAMSHPAEEPHLADNIVDAFGFGQE